MPPPTFNGPKSALSSKCSAGCAPVAMSKQEVARVYRPIAAPHNKPQHAHALKHTARADRKGTRDRRRGSDTGRDRGRHGQGIAARVFIQHRRISRSRDLILACPCVGALDHPRIPGGLPQGHPRVPCGLLQGREGFGNGAGPALSLCFHLKRGCSMCCLAWVGRQGNGRSKVV